MQQSQCKGSVTEPATRCLDDVAVMLEPVSQNEVVQRHNCWRGLKIFFFNHIFKILFLIKYQISGKVDPPAKNLERLAWDDELALLAERWAAQCPGGHDPYDSRSLPGRSTDGVNWKYVGQNICWASYDRTWSECIDEWAMEQDDFTYGVGRTGQGQVGHYTQVVAQRSHFVG